MSAYSQALAFDGAGAGHVCVRAHPSALALASISSDCRRASVTMVAALLVLQLSLVPGTVIKPALLAAAPNGAAAPELAERGLVGRAKPKMVAGAAARLKTFDVNNDGAL